MQQLILHHLNRVEREKSVRILFACETGSRGWGFASPDSDYDVRFVFVHPRDRYLAIHEPPDTITTIFEDGGEVLDFNGWDLRKTLHHLHKSNATPFEWLQSPIVYRQEDHFQDDLWGLAPLFFSPRATVHHYLGICHNSIKTGISEGNINIKKYFYILRPLLAAIWAAEKQTVPPMEFQPLLAQIEHNTPVISAVRQLLAAKENALEAQRIPLVPVLQAFIETEMERCKTLASDLPKTTAASEVLDIFFRKMLTI